MDTAVLAGALDLPDYDQRRREYLACDWLPPKWDWIDPLKDARAEIEQIEAGLKSCAQALAERGYDAEQVDTVRRTLAMRLSSRPALEWASIPLAAMVCSVMPVATADAHGFGQRYDLPIPLGFYIVGAGATVALSFVLVAVFFTAERLPRLYPRVVLHVPARGWASRLQLAIRAAVATFFVFLIFPGIAGEQNPFRNIVVVSVWIIGWGGISLGSLLGDVWRLIDP